MATDLIFVMVKPDGVKRGLVGEIISRFEKRGFVLEELKVCTPTEEQAQAHYAEHAGKVFYERLIQFTLSGKVVAMVWNGNIRVARQIIGDSSMPYDNPPGTIRGDFGNSAPENVVHCSDSYTNAMREMGVWFD